MKRTALILVASWCLVCGCVAWCAVCWCVGVSRRQEAYRIQAIRLEHRVRNVETMIRIREDGDVVERGEVFAAVRNGGR